MNAELWRGMLIPKSTVLFMTGLVVEAAAQELPSINQKKVHDLYIEGDFDGVLREIATFRQSHTEYSRNDSAFIARHLAVVYAADPDYVEQGKYQMNELLKLMPTADLSDMFVSIEINRMFEAARKEYLSRLPSLVVDTLKAEPSPRDGGNNGGVARKTPPAPSSRRVYWLIGGATAVTTVGITSYLVMSSSREPVPEKEIRIPRYPQSH